MKPVLRPEIAGSMPSQVQALTKAQIRSKILSKLKTQKEAERDRKNKLIKERLFKSPVFKKAKKVMFYISCGGEVDTREMIKEAYNLGKMVAAPVCTADGDMKPCVLNKNAHLVRGRYGILEPAVKKFMDLEDLNLVIVPGVAFDKKGNRLGRGKGYYDRFLKKRHQGTSSIGLAFDFQILPSLPTTPTDISVDKIIFA